MRGENASNESCFIRLGLRASWAMPRQAHRARPKADSFPITIFEEEQVHTGRQHR